MVLEKHKVYKIFHNPHSFGDAFFRDYVLVCPKNDVVLDDGFIKGKKFRNTLKCWNEARYRNFLCTFIICFDGKYSFEHDSSVSEDCYLEELNDDDLKDIRKILQHMSEMGEIYVFNRKLGKIVSTNDIRKK